MLRFSLVVGVILWILSSQQCRAQSPSPRMIRSVKQIDEFLKRFYYQQTPDQRPLTTDSLRLLYPRQAYLFSLFNSHDERRRTQSAYKQAIDHFVIAMSESAEQPANLYEGLLAVASFKTLYHNKLETLITYWRMVQYGNTKSGGAQGWQLVGFTAPFLEPFSETINGLPTLDTTNAGTLPRALSPNTHETSFLEFHRLVKQGENLRLIVLDSLAQTPAGQALLWAIRRRELQVVETERLSLFIPTHVGWIVRVDEFPRDDDNSGWLISDLYDCRSSSRLSPALVLLLRDCSY